jgi:hypothetical protein
MLGVRSFSFICPDVQVSDTNHQPKKRGGEWWIAKYLWCAAMCTVNELRCGVMADGKHWMVVIECPPMHGRASCLLRRVFRSLRSSQPRAELRSASEHSERPFDDTNQRQSFRRWPWRDRRSGGGEGQLDLSRHDVPGRRYCLRSNAATTSGDGRLDVPLRQRGRLPRTTACIP